MITAQVCASSLKEVAYREVFVESGQICGCDRIFALLVGVLRSAPRNKRSFLGRTVLIFMEDGLHRTGGMRPSPMLQCCTRIEAFFLNLNKKKVIIILIGAHSKPALRLHGMEEDGVQFPVGPQ